MDARIKSGHDEDYKDKRGSVVGVVADEAQPRTRAIEARSLRGA